MDFNEYEQITHTTWLPLPLGEPRESMLIACGEEVGEALGVLKRLHRGDYSYDVARLKVLKELGDLLYYMTRAAIEWESSLEEVAQLNVGKLADRKERGVLAGTGDDR